MFYLSFGWSPEQFYTKLEETCFTYLSVGRIFDGPVTNILNYVHFHKVLSGTNANGGKAVMISSLALFYWSLSER